jgi:hypothetical protein
MTATTKKTTRPTRRRKMTIPTRNVHDDDREGQGEHN